MRMTNRGVSMVDDKDIPNSYILYFVAVIAMMGLLVLGGVLFWLR